MVLGFIGGLLLVILIVIVLAIIGFVALVKRVL